MPRISAFLAPWFWLVIGTLSYGHYYGGGVRCPHAVFPVSEYWNDMFDAATLIPGNRWDGRMGGQTTAVAWRPDSRVYYVPAHAADSPGSGGDWLPLTANLHLCPRVPNGACCEPHTGACIDDVAPMDCSSPTQWFQDATCAALEPACGNPGACCQDDGGICIYDYALNCTRRFVPGLPEGGVVGQPCIADPFTPPCGQWQQLGLLYAPTHYDNPEFRSAVAELLGEPVDYFAAHLGTPTVEQMMAYRAVLTWVDFPYDDSELMGDRLADYVDLGGKALLGQWCFHDMQANYLTGRIMTPDYFPVRSMVTPFSPCSYAGDGLDCIHVRGPVSQYENLASVIWDLWPGAAADGTCGGRPAQAWRPDRRVYCNPGHTGMSWGPPGDWVQLTANLVVCGDSVWYGACCERASGLCSDAVESLGCATPDLDFYPDVICTELDPPCGAAPCLSRADANCDGELNVLDIDPFVLALTASEAWQSTYDCDFLCANDTNCDGAVNSFDIDPFVLCLTAGCQACP
jgi:hypothetical protein